MNVLGKIFVIANLIFSVITAALIVVVFTTRTSWSASHAAAVTVAKAYQSDAATYAELVHKTKAEEKKKQDALAGDLATATKALQDIQNDNTRVIAERDKQKAAYDKVVQEIKAMGEGNNRLQKENALVKTQLGDSNRRLVELEKDKATFRNRAVEAEIAAATQKEQNERLLDDNERLTRELQKAQAIAVSGGVRAGAGVVTQRNPPLEDLEGIVEDSRSGFVTISLGSNHGLKVNDTLEVFRLAPEGKYLGTIRIESVRADKAVGKPVKTPLSPIQVGDRVASRILGG